MKRTKLIVNNILFCCYLWSEKETIFSLNPACPHNSGYINPPEGYNNDNIFINILSILIYGRNLHYSLPYLILYKRILRPKQ